MMRHMIFSFTWLSKFARDIGKRALANENGRNEDTLSGNEVTLCLSRTHGHRIAQLHTALSLTLTYQPSSAPR